MKTAKFALTVAGIVLAVVAISRYTEIVERRSMKAAVGEGSGASAGDATGGAGANAGGGAMGDAASAAARQAEIEDMLAARLKELEEKFGATAEQNAAKDNELQRLQGELAELKEERAKMDRKIDQMEVRDAVSRQLEEQNLTDVQRRVRNAVPIASVTAFDSQWGFVTLDAGQSVGLTAGKKLAIRRDDKIVAELQVSSADLNTCVADVIRSDQRQGDNGQPKPGDSVIAWPF